MEQPFLQPTQQPLRAAPKLLLLAIAAVALIGFSDATYLAAKFYQGVPPPCSLLEGCEVVTTSQYATVGGISVALLGAIYYLAVLVISIAIIDTKNDRLKKFLAGFSVIGLLASIWFISLQLFVLKALCLYCLVSAFSSTAIFLTAFFLKKDIVAR